ncbi:MAG: RNA methyltransferase [Vampirovibrionales bacterium]|nr:RNA methyltransferase [Vampirovibrionales bacterium]
MPTERRQELIHRVSAARQRGVVVIEDVHDPHNAAAVFRSCEAFGFQDVRLIFDQEKPFTPRKLGRATSASANKWLTFKTFTSTQACLDELHTDGYEVIATALDDRAESFFEASFLSPRLALMFGNEHRGLSAQALAMADRIVCLPMAGVIQSLNLSVTAGITLFETTRQRRAAGLEPYLLPASERLALAQDLLAR